MSHGVAINNYHGDNGTAFTSWKSVWSIVQMEQHMSFSGVGAHFQNGVAERAIWTVVTHARIMMINKAACMQPCVGPHWPMPHCG